MAKIIALGGNIASGKTAVSNILRSLGAAIVDTDLIAREIVAPFAPAWHSIVKEFGWEYILPDNNIDRIKLGSLIFRDESARKKLNAITHPLIREIAAEKIKKLGRDDTLKVIVIVIPLLFESDFPIRYDASWFVAADDELRLSRLMERDGIDREKALIKISAQMPQADKVKKADKVFYNNTDMDELKRTVTTEYNKLTENI